MFVKVSNGSETLSFDDVEKIIFHTDDTDVEYKNFQAIHYQGSYKSFTLVRQLSERVFDNSFEIIDLVD